MILRMTKITDHQDNNGLLYDFALHNLKNQEICRVLRLLFNKTKFYRGTIRVHNVKQIQYIEKIQRIIPLSLQDLWFYQEP